MEKVQELLRVLLPVALGLWLVGSAVCPAGRWIWHWHQARTRFGRLGVLRYARRTEPRRHWLVWGFGIAVGGWTGRLLYQRNPEIWVLVLIVVIALLLEEMREPKCLAVLPDVVQFLNRYCAAVADGHDVYGALAATAEELPPGEVLRAIEGALEKQIRHLAPPEVFRPLEKVSPYLQEFVLALQSSGWKGSENLRNGLRGITRRAAQEVDQTSRARLRFEQLRPWVRWGRAWLIGGMLAVLFLSAGPSLFAAMIEKLDGFFIWISLIALVMLFYLVFSQPWLRRVVVIGCVAMVLLVLNGPEQEKSVIAGAPTASSTAKEVTSIVTVTVTVTITPTRTGVLTPTNTPKPVVRRGKVPVLLPENAKPLKRPQLYPAFWKTPGP